MINDSVHVYEYTYTVRASCSGMIGISSIGSLVRGVNSMLFPLLNHMTAPGGREFCGHSATLHLIQHLTLPVSIYIPAMY